MTEWVRLLLASALDSDYEVELILVNIYSQLSGTAHAGASALGMYLDVERQPMGFIYPRQIAFEHVGYMFAAVTRLGELTIEHFAISGVRAERWEDARARAVVASKRLLRAA